MLNIIIVSNYNVDGWFRKSVMVCWWSVWFLFIICNGWGGFGIWVNCIWKFMVGIGRFEVKLKYNWKKLWG